MIQAHPEYGYRRLETASRREQGLELKRRGLVVNGLLWPGSALKGLPWGPNTEERIRRLLRDYHLALKRNARFPRPNPLRPGFASRSSLIVEVAEERANLAALLLKEQEPRPLELVYTDFTMLLYGGGRVWFLPFLDHRTRMVLGDVLSPSPTAAAFP